MKVVKYGWVVGCETDPYEFGEELDIATKSIQDDSGEIIDIKYSCIVLNDIIKYTALILYTMVEVDE